MLCPFTLVAKKNHSCLAPGQNTPVSHEEQACPVLVPGAHLEQGHLEQVAQGHVSQGLEHLQGQRLHNFSGQCGLDFDHLLSEKKSGFLMLTQFPVSACCLWSSDWEPVRRDLHLSFPHQGRCIHSHTWARLPWAFSSPGCVVLPLSASPHFIIFPHTVWNYPRWHTNTTSPSHL